MTQTHQVAARASCRCPLTLERCLVGLRGLAIVAAGGLAATGVWGVMLAEQKTVKGVDDGVVFQAIMGVYFVFFGLLLIVAEVRRGFCVKLLKPFGFLRYWIGRAVGYAYLGSLLLFIPWDPEKHYASQIPAIGLLSIALLELVVSLAVRREQYAMAGSKNEGRHRSFAEGDSPAPAAAGGGSGGKAAGARKSRGVGDVVDAGAIRWGEPESANAGSGAGDVETGHGHSGHGHGHSHSSSSTPSSAGAGSHKSTTGGRGGGKGGRGGKELAVAGSSANVFANPITGATEAAAGGGGSHQPAPGANPFLAGGHSS